MKKAITYLGTFIFAVSLMAATPDLKILKTFKETFPNAQNVQWRDDSNGFFASFTQNGNFNKVFYNTSGDFVYSLKYSDGSELPTNIAMELNKDFNASKIIGVTEITTATRTVYNVKLSKEDKLYNLNILADGSVATQEEFTNGDNEAGAK